MAIKTNNEGTILHFAEVFRERGISFAIASLSNTPQAIRRLLEDVLGVNWNVTCITQYDYSNSGDPYIVDDQDVVILVEANKDLKYIRLPDPSASSGRLLIVKANSYGVDVGYKINISCSTPNAFQDFANEIIIENRFGGVILLSGCSGSDNKWLVLGTI